jgi:hypothetical protein
MIENEEAFYNCYSVIFDQQFSIQKKNVLFTSLMAGEPWGWKVIGITERAITELSKNNYKYQTGLICRSHFISRNDTAKAFFGVPVKISREDFFPRYFQTDKTVISLKSENTEKGPDRFILINQALNLFASRLVGFNHGKEERNYLRELHLAFKKGEIRLEERPIIPSPIDT